MNYTIEFVFMGTYMTVSDIDSLNSISTDCRYAVSRRRGVLIPQDVLIVVFDLLKNAGYNAAYDIMKNAVNAIHSQIMLKSRHPNQIIFSHGSKRIVFDANFDMPDDIRKNIAHALVDMLFNE